MSPTAYFHGGHIMGMRAVIDPQYLYLSVFMTSFVATAPEVTAYEWIAGQLHNTFHTMAEAAIVDM